MCVCVFLSHTQPPQAGMFGLGLGPQTCSMCSPQVPLGGGKFSQLVETPRSNHTSVVSKQSFYRHPVVSLSCTALLRRCTLNYDSPNATAATPGGWARGPHLLSFLPSFALPLPASSWHLATFSAPQNSLKLLIYVTSLAVFIVIYPV